jgi:hypothetical protein
MPDRFVARTARSVAVYARSSAGPLSKLTFRLFAVLLAAVTVVAILPGPAEAAGIGAYRGLATWVSIYDSPVWNNPTASVAAMNSRGVRTLFLQTGNWRIDQALFNPSKTETLIHAAHAQGIKVVGWYLPGFDRPTRDYRRVKAAIEFRTSAGQRFDSFGLDIESTNEKDVAVRTARLLKLAKQARSLGGRRYPLSAIVLTPQMLERNTAWWPGFPWQQLTQYFNVFVPMAYFTTVTSSAAGAHDYVATTVKKMRQLTGRPALPIHVIGGSSHRTTARQVRAAVRAMREHGVLGGSLWYYSATDGTEWAQLAAIPVNPLQRPPLPVQLPDARELGNIPRSDRKHPKEVFYVTGGVSGSRQVQYQGYDIQTGEVQLWVNWRRVATLKRSRADRWSGTRYITVADGYLRDSGTNYIQFVAQGDFPNWSRWGVRKVALG